MGSECNNDQQSIVAKRAANRLSAIAKAMLAATLMGVLVSQLDLGEIAKLADTKGAAFLILATLLGVPLLLFDSLNLSLVLRAAGYRLGVGAALMYAIVGTFFSNLAPSTLGGDVFRVFQMNRVGVPLENSIRLALVTRMTAFSALILVILLGFPFMLSSNLEPLSRLLVSTCLVMATVALLAALVADRIVWPLGSTLINRMTRISHDLRQVLIGSKFSPAIILSAVVVHLMRVLIVYTLSLAVGAHLSLVDLFVVVPIALLLAMIPISFASWGIREATFIYFLGQLGSTFEMAFSISVLFGVHRALFGAAGGLVWIGVGARNGIFAVHPLAS
jgi:uncharacterized protein (TIRG00374 family)